MRPEEETGEAEEAAEEAGVLEAAADSEAADEAGVLEAAEEALEAGVLEASLEAGVLDAAEESGVLDAAEAALESLAGEVEAAAVVAVAVANEVPEGTIDVQPLGRTAVVVPDQQIT